MTAAAPLLLEAVAGPRPLRVELPSSMTHIIGRGAGSTLLLEDPSALVSRRHCQLFAEAGQWRLEDLGSKHGTRLNGAALEANQPLAVRSGDFVTVGPWTLSVGLGGDGDPQTFTDQSRVGSTSIAARRLLTEDDRERGARGVQAVRPGDAALAADRLGLLLQVAEGIHRSESIEKLGEVVLSAVAGGTRFGNVAIIRPMAADGTVEIVCVRTDEGTAASRFRFSRSIVLQASKGVVTAWTAEDSPVAPMSTLAELEITEALCVPFVVEGVLLALLYMDNRHGRRMTRGSADDREFAIAVGRFASLALRNLLQRDVAARLALVTGELHAAAQMQRMIMPGGCGTTCGVNWAGEYRPGRVVSGDFFDITPLADGRLAVALGDVSGKGVAAAVLAVLVQGCLRGALLAGLAPVESIRMLHSLVWARAEAERFVTLWLGVIDAAAGRVSYVDAGHGHVYLLHGDGSSATMSEGGGPPLGSYENATYHAIERGLLASDLLVLASDGLVEQPSSRGGDNPERFEKERLLAAIAPGAPDLAPAASIERIFAAVKAWAGTQDLHDDATLVAARLG